MKSLSQSFFRFSADRVAPKLLGCLLYHRTHEGTTVGRIVETEAYLGANDPASHAYRGPTKRNLVMFGPPGHAYIYFTYGMHYCFNVVTAPDGVGEAVLIRALEPIQGIPLMQRRRGRDELHELTNGPAKLVQAMGITRQEYGAPLFRGRLKILSGNSNIKIPISKGPRIGISTARELPLRFWVSGNDFVSK